jgi:hypothetical protein
MGFSTEHVVVQRFRMKRAVWGVGLFSALLWSAASLATAMVRLDLPTLTHTAQLIVRGHVTQMQSRWTGDGRQIVTDVELEVDESLKGEPARRLVIQQLGGQVGNIGQRVSGLASFERGEEVVVFLQAHGRGSFRVSGLAQGKFKVERSVDGKAAFAVPNKHDALLLDPITRAPTESNLRPMRLEELREAIRAALQNPPNGTPRP